MSLKRISTPEGDVYFVDSVTGERVKTSMDVVKSEDPISPRLQQLMIETHQIAEVEAGKLHPSPYDSPQETEAALFIMLLEESMLRLKLPLHNPQLIIEEVKKHYGLNESKARHHLAMSVEALKQGDKIKGTEILICYVCGRDLKRRASFAGKKVGGVVMTGSDLESILEDTMSASYKCRNCERLRCRACAQTAGTCSCGNGVFDSI